MGRVNFFFWGGGVIFVITLSLIYLETATTQCFWKYFFYEFLQEMGMHQELLFADILKFSKKVFLKIFIFCASQESCYGKSVLLAAYFKLLL